MSKETLTKSIREIPDFPHSGNSILRCNYLVQGAYRLAGTLGHTIRDV